MIVAVSRRLLVAASSFALAGCSIGSQPTFVVSNASVDTSYTCPVGSNNTPYDLHATVDAHNGTSNAVTISSVDVSMTLAAVKGSWLQKVGDKYDAGSVTFAPASVASGSDTELTLTIPSACTGRTSGSPVASGEYNVSFTIVTSAGTFKLDSKDRHRIVTG